MSGEESASETYIADVYAQADDMVRVASARHPEIIKDCSSDPDLIRKHWRDELLIDYVDSVNSEFQKNDGSTYDDGENGLLGLYLSASGSHAKAKAWIQWKREDFTPRRNFTLLHELGHHLQKTDRFLAKRLFLISSTNYSKKFEEDACNRFASLMLLPEELVKTYIEDKFPDSTTVMKLFNDGRDTKTHRIRVSRDVVSRRLAEFLPPNSCITLAARVQDKTQQPDSPMMVHLRAWSNKDRRVEYGTAFIPAEEALIGRIGKSNHMQLDATDFLQIDASQRPVKATINKSYGGIKGGGRREYCLMVLQSIGASCACDGGDEPITKPIPSQGKALTSRSQKEHPLDGHYVLERTLRKNGHRTVHTEMDVIGGVFTIHAGQRVNSIEGTGIPDVIHRMRLSHINEEGIVLKEACFNSPSAAAAFVIGNSCNGWMAWKNQEGISLNVFRSLSSNSESTSAREDTSSEGTSEIFVLTSNIKREQGRNIEAKLIVKDNSFIVLKGSTVSLTKTASCPASAANIRKDERYVRDGVVVRDMVFASPSAASCFVLGSSCNGWKQWKTADGKTLKEISS